MLTWRRRKRRRLHLSVQDTGSQVKKKIVAVDPAESVAAREMELVLAQSADSAVQQGKKSGGMIPFFKVMITTNWSTNWLDLLRANVAGT